METIEDFYNQAEANVQPFNNFVANNGLVGEIGADHICYNCESGSVFEWMRRLFEAQSSFIYQSIISGRRIAYIKLKRKIPTVAGEINYLELSDQKPGGCQRNSFDHIEFYLIIPADYHDYAWRLRVEKGLEVIEEKRPHHWTYGIPLGKDFTARLAPSRLVTKIRQREFV